MRGLGRRLLKTAVPAAVILAVFGYFLSEIATVWYDAHVGKKPGESDNLGESLRGRVPVMMAAWGFGVLVVYEVLRTLWLPADKPKPAAPVGPTVEDQIQQLLRDVAARDLAQTPPPAGCPSPAGADNTAHDPPL
jgi:hypothetical protein